MTFALTGYMLYAMWGILILIGIDFIMGLYRAFKLKIFNLARLTDFLSGLLYDVFPLIILVSLMPLDPTGWIILIAYYIGAAGVVWKYLMEIRSKI